MIQGSTWKKWNFHVHTKGTNKNDQFSSPSMDAFFCTFYKKAFEKEILAIGITDYFSIERYNDAIAYRDKIESKINTEGQKIFRSNEIDFIKQIFIFPNVELRLLPATDSGRLINIHCLFNPDYVTNLGNDFFSHIMNQDRCKMNRQGITSYGQTLDTSLTNEQKQYEKGIENFVIDLKELTNLQATNKKFKDNCLLVVSNSNKDGASAVQQHYDLFENNPGSLDGLRKSIYFASEAIFSGNPKDVQYFTGRKQEGAPGFDDAALKHGIEEVIKERGSLKPCIVGCDAHKEEDLFTKFTWVKADLNFEGLKQICFEPEHRVRIQTVKPDFKEEKLVIEKIAFTSPQNIFSTTPVFLNPNLNVIIGGKSSGKSILLYAIARTLSAEDSVLKNDDGQYKYDLSKIDQNFNFTVTTKGGFSQNLLRAEGENSILPEIKYIPQNYLVKLAEPELNKKGKSLNELVRDLIIEDDSSKESYQVFVDQVMQNDKFRNSQVDLLFETVNSITTLENELKGKSKKEVLEKNIENNAKKVEDLNKSTGLTETQIEEYKTFQMKLEQSDASLSKFKNDFAAVQSFNADLSQLIKTLKQKKDSLMNGLQLKEIKDYYTEEYKLVDELLEKAAAIEKSIEVETKAEGKRILKDESGKFKAVLGKISAEQKQLKESLLPFLKDEQTKKAIEELNTSITNDRKAIMDIELLAGKIQEKRKLFNDTKTALFVTYIDSYQKYLEVISELKERTVELEKDGLQIVGKAHYNFPRLKKNLLAVSDGRTASYNSYPFLDKKATDDIDFDSHLQNIKALYEDLLSKKYVITNKTTISNAIKIILSDEFFDDWEITYKNDRLGEMSTGKASFVILMLIIGLSKSKAPILIDQPEDNLDNRSITTDLVNYLRNKKLERQIIIVTHNANIVVNADAENIIVASQQGQNETNSSSVFKFDYINGAIENSFEKLTKETDILKSMGIRQHIADIVEGGKDAFIMREKKYQFN
jgi:predicted ATPase